MRNILPVAVLLFAGFVSPVHAAADSKPNVIVILADDMGLDSVSAMNDRMGMKTPAIDRFIHEGMTFGDAHSTSAVCTPTRYGVLTGRYNWRSRLKRGIVGKWERPLIKDERITMPEMFQQHGYDTACIGKWHLGWHWPKKGGGTTSNLKEIDFKASVKGGPNDHGFDYYFGDDVPNWPPFAWRENDRVLGEIDSQMKRGLLVGVNDGPAVKGWDFRAVLHEYGQRCPKYISERKSQEKPFFLYVPLPSPHTPIAPHKTFQGKSNVSEYADFLIQTDDVVDRIMSALKDSGQDETTLVFFTCDNGTSPKAEFETLEAGGIRINDNWRGYKADAFEGGHRVPFAVRWPGNIQPDSSCDHTITTADIMATCAELLEFELPANCAEDSVSLMPTLQGKTTDPLHDVVVHHSVSGHFAIRKGDWKLLFCQGSGGWSAPREAAAKKQKLPPIQLYNLKDDSKESTNVYADHSQVVQELTADLRRVIENGRSTPGPNQPNHDNAKWWPGLPWPK